MAQTRCTVLSSLKASIIIRCTIIVVILASTLIDAGRLRLTMNRARLKQYTRNYQNYIKSLIPKDDEGYQRRRKARLIDPTPSVKTKVYLYCKTGFLLEIDKHGKITGTSNLTSENALLEIEIFSRTIRRVKGVASGRYLSINHRGRLTSTVSQNKHTFFNEKYEENAWYTYSSKHPGDHCGVERLSKHNEGWFIAIKENGNLRRPCKTRPGMKATHFIIFRPEDIKNMLQNPSKLD